MRATLLRIVSAAVVVAGSALAGAWTPLRAQQQTHEVALQRSVARLRADVWWEPVTGVTFAVNEPAYVAVYDISPLDGIAQLYPTYGSDADRPVPAGLRRVYPAAAQTAYWAFQSSLHASYTGYWKGGPRYLLIVASRRPLRTSQYVGRPFALRTALGWENYMAFRPYSSMDAILSAVLPKPIGGDFSTSYYTLWPSEMRPHYYQTQFRTIGCGGRLIVVPTSFVISAVRLCLEQQQLASQQRTKPASAGSATRLRAPSLPGVIVAAGSKAANRGNVSKSGSANSTTSTPRAVGAQVDLLRTPNRRAIERAYRQVEVHTYDSPGRHWAPAAMPAGRGYRGQANNGVRADAATPRLEGAGRAPSGAARVRSPASAPPRAVPQVLPPPRATVPASAMPRVAPRAAPHHVAPASPPPAPAHKADVHHGNGGTHR